MLLGSDRAGVGCSPAQGQWQMDFPAAPLSPQQALQGAEAHPRWVREVLRPMATEERRKILPPKYFAADLQRERTGHTAGLVREGDLSALGLFPKGREVHNKKLAEGRMKAAAALGNAPANHKPGKPCDEISAGLLGCLRAMLQVAALCHH